MPLASRARGPLDRGRGERIDDTVGAERNNSVFHLEIAYGIRRVIGIDDVFHDLRCRNLGRPPRQSLELDDVVRTEDFDLA